MLDRTPPPASIEALGREAMAVQQARRRGEDPGIEQRWARISPGLDPIPLAALVKADLQARFALGGRPAVAEYLDRFPALRPERDRVVSLVYEEYCLLEERGEPVDPEAFCGRYEPWRDSLVSQLRYHRALSQVVGGVTPAPKFPEPGGMFLWYRLGSVLGQGGAGRVYLAVDSELGDREVALKISPDRGGEPSIQGRLDHAHIVPVLSVAREPETGLRGLCMPYRPGRPLDEVTRRVFEASPRPRKARELWEAARPEREEAGEGTPTWAGFPIRGTYAEGVAWVVAALAEALAHAHDRGVCHRDVKPANVLLTRRDGPQLLDFNLAHDPHAADQAEAALRGGTLPYMAPEQLEAFLDPDCWGSIGPSADIYALGLLLRELLTGRRPESPAPDVPLPRAVNELLDSRDYPPTPIREIVPGTPRALDAIASRCLAVDPADRYARAADLAEDLRLFLDHKPTRHAPRAFDAEAAAHWAARHRRALIAAGAILALGAIALPASRAIRREVVTRKLDMAAIDVEQGRYQKALKFVRESGALESDDPRAIRIEAKIAYKQADFPRSFRLYSEALDSARAGQAGPEGDRQVETTLIDRSAVDIQHGLAKQDAASKTRDVPGYRGSRYHFLRALRDLDEARGFRDVGADDGLLAQIEHQSGLASMGLANIAQLIDNFSEELDWLRKAETATRAVLKIKVKDAPAERRLVEILRREAATDRALKGPAGANPAPSSSPPPR